MCPQTRNLVIFVQKYFSLKFGYINVKKKARRKEIQLWSCQQFMRNTFSCIPIQNFKLLVCNSYNWSFVTCEPSFHLLTHGFISCRRYWLFILVLGTACAKVSWITHFWWNPTKDFRTEVMTSWYLKFMEWNLDVRHPG